MPLKARKKQWLRRGFVHSPVQGFKSPLVHRGVYFALNSRALSNVGAVALGQGSDWLTRAASPRDKSRPRGILAFNNPRSASGILGADPSTMSASQILQHLYSLDTSSPDISRLIYGLIRHDEEDQYLSTLQGSELARLVDFLDKVRSTSFSAVPLVTK